MPVHGNNESERIFGEWQGRVTLGMEHLKESIEKLEERVDQVELQHPTHKEQQKLQSQVDNIQSNIGALPEDIRRANKELSDAIATAFDQRLKDLGLQDIHAQVASLSTEVTNLKQSLQGSALRYGLVGSSVPTVIMILIMIIYYLVTGKAPPSLDGQ